MVVTGFGHLGHQRIRCGPTNSVPLDSFGSRDEAPYGFHDFYGFPRESHIELRTWGFSFSPRTYRTLQKPFQPRNRATSGAQRVMSSFSSGTEAVFSLAQALNTPILGYLSDRFGRRPVPWKRGWNAGAHGGILKGSHGTRCMFKF